MQKLPQINREKVNIYINQKFYNQIFKYSLSLDSKKLKTISFHYITR